VLLTKEIFTKKNKQWKTALCYLQNMAIDFVSSMPDWKDEKNNKSKMAAFTSLNALARAAIKGSDLDQMELKKWEERLSGYEAFKLTVEDIQRML